ncbi:MAG: DUF1501 domain-containing protein [Campylobacterota bacterium]|nr:DUF1501 domain-containing protein [Campylobacterota bacterium]
MTRRKFLQKISLSAFLAPYLLHANEHVKSVKRKNLILIELKGGNDGLNTVVPYANPLYYKYRPTIAIAPEKLLKLNDRVGLHPSLKQIEKLYRDGEVAIWQGVGYKNPNLSHFRSIDIWDTASKSDEYLQSGWLKKHIPKGERAIEGIVLGGEYGPLSGFDQGVIKIKNINSFLNKSKNISRDSYYITDNSAHNHILRTEQEIAQSNNFLKEKLKKTQKLSFHFEKNSFAKQMSSAAKLINLGADIPFYKLSLKSFDTHQNQLKPHANLLHQLSEAIYTLRENLLKSNEWKNTTIMTYSEFGRRPKENANGGTDHGTASVHFVIGGDVKGGLRGEYPSLDSLSKNGNLEYTTDFKEMYSSVL